jgi:hypothetical protein
VKSLTGMADWANPIGSQDMKQHENLTMDNERLARALAATAGIEWASLRDYPGYGKNYWREKARNFFKLDPRAA